MYNYIEVAFGGVNQRNKVIKVEELNKFAKEWKVKNKKYIDCFRTYHVYPEEFLKHFNSTGSVRGYKGSCNSKFFPIDIDSTNLQDALEKTKSFLIKLLVEFKVNLRSLGIYFSGSKGFHIEIPVRLFGRFLPSPKLAEEFKVLARMVSKDVDCTIYDKLRLWRISNTINSKSGLYKIPLTLDEVFNLTIDEITKMAKKPRKGVFFDRNMGENKALKKCYQRASIRVIRPVDKEEKRYKNLSIGTVQEGERNTTLTSYTGRLKAWNIPEGEAFNILSAVNQARCSTPLDDGEVDSIIKSVYKYQSNPFEIKTTTLKELVGKKEPKINFLVEDLLPCGNLVLLAGKPKLGKSLLALLLSLSVGLGIPLWKKRVKKSGVLFISTEDGQVRLQKRVWVMAGKPDKLKGDINFYSGELILTDELVFEALRRKVLELKAKLIILDPLINLFRKKELNSAEDMNEVLRPLQTLAKDTGACILVIHHARKSSGDDAIDVVQGSITISGVADGLLILRSFKSQEKRATLEVILKDAEIPKKVVLKLDERLRWNVEGSLEEVEKKNLRKETLETLHKERNGLAIARLEEILGVGYKPLYNTLCELESDNLVTSLSVGRSHTKLFFASALLKKNEGKAKRESETADVTNGNNTQSYGTSSSLSRFPDSQMGNPSGKRRIGANGHENDEALRIRLREIDEMKNLTYLEKLHMKIEEIKKMKEKSYVDTTNGSLDTTTGLSQEKSPINFNLIEEKTLTGLLRKSSLNKWKAKSNKLKNIKFKLMDEKKLKDIFQDLSPNSWEMIN